MANSAAEKYGCGALQHWHGCYKDVHVMINIFIRKFGQRDNILFLIYC